MLELRLSESSWDPGFPRMPFFAQPFWPGLKKMTESNWTPRIGTMPSLLSDDSFVSFHWKRRTGVLTPGAPREPAKMYVSPRIRMANSKKQQKAHQRRSVEICPLALGSVIEKLLRLIQIASEMHRKLTAPWKRGRRGRTTVASAKTFELPRWSTQSYGRGTKFVWGAFVGGDLWNEIIESEISHMREVSLLQKVCHQNVSRLLLGMRERISPSVL